MTIIMKVGEKMSVKIDIISGFLGAGKTTLIKKLFETGLKNEKVVLIENEFGEIGIDGAFLKESGVNIKEINSGCICCSLVGDFSTSMKEVVDTYHPERIIIEPSGVGKLSDIIKAVEKLEIDLKLNIVATVVDGGKCKLYMKNFGEFFNNQVEDANTIVISKVSNLLEEKIIETYQLLKEKNSNANIVLADLTTVRPEKLIEILEKNVSFEERVNEEFKKEQEHECCHHHHEEDGEEHECCHHHHDGHHHDADEVFISVGFETATSYSRNELEQILESLTNEESYGIVLRAKGILRASDQVEWHYFDYVAGDYSIRKGESDFIGRFVVIGSKIKKENIEKLILKK